MKRSVVFSLAVSFFFLYLSPLLAASLSEREARKLIEDNWNKPYVNNVVIKLGEYRVLNDSVKADINKGQLNTGEYKAYQAWEKIGVIEIDKDKYSKKLNALQNINAQILGDQVAHIWIKATSKGIELGAKRGQPMQDSIIFKYGTFTITDVVKFEERKKGVDEYRMIMFKYQAQWEPTYQEYGKATGRSLSKDRKAILLFKYDVFSNEWKIVSIDNANFNEEFSTKNVEKALAQ